MPQISAHPTGTATWYDLTTGKPEETKRFYSELFGWTFHDGGPQFGHYHIVNKGDSPVAGFMPKTAEMAQMPSALSRQAEPSSQTPCRSVLWVSC